MGDNRSLVGRGGGAVTLPGPGIIGGPRGLSESETERREAGPRLTEEAECQCEDEARMQHSRSHNRPDKPEPEPRGRAQPGPGSCLWSEYGAAWLSVPSPPSAVPCEPGIVK